MACGNSFWSMYLCNSQDVNSPCRKGCCDNCEGGKRLLASVERDPGENVYWHEWNTCESGRLVKTTKNGCIGLLLEEISESFPVFQEHVHIKHIQFMHSNMIKWMKMHMSSR